MSWVLTGVPVDVLTTLGLSLGAALVVLYVLRVRRRRVEVPFSPLWASVLAERKANAWWERLKRLLSLLVQLLLLGVLLLALADPRTDDVVEEGRSVVVLLDASASMQAVDGEGIRRFDDAREQVLEQLELLGPKDEAMVVALDARMRPLTPFTSDLATLREAVEQMAPTATAADLRAGVSFAVDALAGRSNGVVVLASDFATPSSSTGAVRDSARREDGSGDAPADGSGGAEANGSHPAPPDGSGGAPADGASETSAQGSGDAIAGGADTPTATAPDGSDDGRLDLPQTVAWLPLVVGEAGGNVGISAFNVRRYPSNRTNVEVFVQLRNQADVAVEVELSLFGEGRLIEVVPLTLGAGEEARRSLPDLPTSGDELEARVRIVGGEVVDRFPLDDVAYARLPDARALRVLAVTPGNLYLEAPLLLNESIDVTTLSPEAYAAPNLGDPSAGYDVTIFDDVTPDTAETGNYLYLRPDGPYSPWEIRGEVTDPIIDSTRSGHSLLRWISALRDVNIASAQRLQLDTTDRSVASAIGGAPMLVTRVTPGSRRAALAFRPQDSDLPLRVAWPVLLLNALDWFTQDDASLIESYRTGETWFVPMPDRTIERVTLTSPGGETRSLDVHGGRIALFGDEVGFWRLEAGVRVWTIAGNLADANESRIAPGSPEDVVRDAPIATLEDASQQLDWDPWMALVALAFVVFFVEWWTWNRRWTV